MREEIEIRKRFSEIDEEIKQWQVDLKKELNEPKEYRDEGYVTHCRVVIAEFKSEKNTLVWVLGEPPKKLCGVTGKECEYVCVVVGCFLLSEKQNVKASVATESDSKENDDKQK